MIDNVSVVLSRQELFVDQSVYSKNRNFRLFLCSKFGKTAALELSKTAAVPSNKDRRQIFLDSLITHFADGKPGRLLRVSGSVAAESASDSRRFFSHKLHHDVLFAN